RSCTLKSLHITLSCSSLNVICFFLPDFFPPSFPFSFSQPFSLSLFVSAFISLSPFSHPSHSIFSHISFLFLLFSPLVSLSFSLSLSLLFSHPQHSFFLLLSSLTFHFQPSLLSSFSSLSPHTYLPPATASIPAIST